MARSIRVVAFLLFGMAASLAATPPIDNRSAQGTLTIKGSVFDDPPALALPQNFRPLHDVTVHLFRDGGDNQPSHDDALLMTAQTGAGGDYVFHPRQAGTYWVVVDSKTIPSPAAAPEKTWADQTFGSRGALCARPDGRTAELPLAGPCVSGRSSERSDDARAADTAEHLARVVVGDSPASVDFAFSFNLVTSVADSALDAPAIQGSLRQFVVNANALPGPNVMRFVPFSKPVLTDRPLFDGDPARWWSIALRRPLPPLREGGTTIDGTAYSFLSTNSPRKNNLATKGQVSSVGEGIATSPDLEIVTMGEEGIACDGVCTLRHIAIYGATVAIVTRADATIEDVVAGAHADASAVGARGSAGIQIERGHTIVRNSYAGDQNTGGIVVAAAGATLEATRVQVERCGQPEGGAGIILLSDGSTIRASLIQGNYGAGIAIGLPGSVQPARQNVIANSIVSANGIGIVLSPGASDNRITGNGIMLNRFDGIAVAPYQSSAIPLHNRISGNHFDENGGRPIRLDPTRAVTAEVSEDDSCTRNPVEANGGIRPPRVTSARNVRNEATGGRQIVVQGIGCPGSAVELYQSFAPSAARGNAESRSARGGKGDNLESVQSSTGAFLPSIGEFNPIATLTVKADGHFEFVVPVVDTPPTRPVSRKEELGYSLRFRDVFTTADEVANGAFSALTIDPDGNTSEFGMRRVVR
ncbi:MAG: right-handed parallel beta-helix repeat-containing protein [Acidobacteriota bacterium]